MMQVRTTIGNIKRSVKDGTTTQGRVIQVHAIAAGTTPLRARLIPIRQVSR